MYIDILKMFTMFLSFYIYMRIFRAIYRLLVYNEINSSLY